MMWTERGKTVALVMVAVACFITVSEIEYQTEILLVDARFERCIRSMGASTDLEISEAIVECAKKTSYVIREEDWP